MQSPTISLLTLTLTLAAAASGALAATCNAVLTGSTTLSGTTCPISQVSGGAWYEKTADCGSAATVTLEDARGGSAPVAASISIAASGASTRVSWSEVSYSSTNNYYVDLVAGASCERTLGTGFNVEGVTYA